MKKKCVVMVLRGREYLWKMSSKLSVSNKSADYICEILNKMKWALTDDYVWAVRDYNDDYYATYGKAYVNRGYVKVKYEYGFNR